MDRHANLISSVTELYTLLVQLATIEPSLLVIPDAAAIAQFPREAALEAGFYPEAVNLMARLPYLAIGSVAFQPDIKPSTVPVDYYTDRHNEGDFEDLRWMDDDPDNEDNLIPGHSIRLTQQDVYGYSLIYNTETCLMTEWNSIDEPQEIDGYAHLPARNPSEILKSWIEPYRSLDILRTPVYTLWDKRYLTDGEPPSHYSEREKLFFRNTRELEMALWKLKDLYLECGWDVTSKEQDSFDRDEFVKLRQRHMGTVVKPLERQHEEAMRPLDDQNRETMMRDRDERGREEL